jgi:hypothetical protein
MVLTSVDLERQRPQDTAMTAHGGWKVPVLSTRNVSK